MKLLWHLTQIISAIILTVYSQVNNVVQTLPYSSCDTTTLTTTSTPTYAECTYTSTDSVLLDTCLVYFGSHSNYCIRCKAGLYLTMLPGYQRCSTAILPAAGSVATSANTCTIAHYDAALLTAAGISSGSLLVQQVQDNNDGSLYHVCWNFYQILQQPTLCSAFTGVKTPNKNLGMASAGCFVCNQGNTTISGTTYSIIPTSTFMSFYGTNGININDCLLGSSSIPALQICQFGMYYDTRMGSCQICQASIDNCLTCSGRYTCNMCQPQYKLLQLTDPSGFEYSSCLFQFCGLDTVAQIGITNQCKTCYASENCLRCNVHASYTIAGNVIKEYDDCIQCSPGYQRVLQTVSCPTCLPSLPTEPPASQQNLTVNFYVFSNNENMMFSSNTTTPVTGISYNSPYNFLMQAMNDINIQYTVSQGTSNPAFGIYPIYQNITYNIWLGKGIHYFFWCPNGYNSLEPLFVDVTISNACFVLPLLEPTYPVLDNTVINVAPMDCAFQNTVFLNQGFIGSNFINNCVNVAGGQQPQVRIQNQYAFNITNQATFSNILFTGIDNLATIIDGSSFNLALYPQQKCWISGVNPPTGAITTTNLQSLSSISGFTYGCYMPLNTTQILNYTFQQGCNAKNLAQYGFQGMGSCVGQPLNQNFFVTSEYNQPYTNYAFYEQRHFVLFNLYSFDITTTSDSTIEPTLYLTNCTFQYMFGMEALINIETTNYFITANKDLTNALLAVQVQENTLFLFGADDGVNIQVSGSTFQNSYFCWGLIKYRKELTQYIQNSQVQTSTSRFFNMTNYVMNNIATPAVPNVISLSNSLFQNLDYQNQLVALTQSNNIQVNITGGFFFLEPVITNKGLILNLQGYAGNIIISNCQFQKNMVNIPGLAYTPQYSSNQFLPWLAVQSMPQFYQNQQYYCLGALIPQIQPSELIATYIENYSLIYLSQMFQSTLTITNSTFTDNISLHGTVRTYGIQSVNLTGNNWQRNMAYFVGNAASFDWVVFNITAYSNFFSDNMGIIQTQGTLVIKNSNLVNLTLNTFDNNMVGQIGSAVYAKNNTNVQIINNQFLLNGPALSIWENEFSPYFNYLLNGLRLVGFYNPANTTLGNQCISEFQFYEVCQPLTGGTIQLPNILGAVALSYPTTVTGAMPQILVSQNYFYQNNVMPIFNSAQQSLNQSSALVLFGQASLVIQNNQFRSHKGSLAPLILNLAPVIYNSQPTNYWSYSHAPVIQLTTQSAIIQNNIFTDNANYQVNMQGGLVQFQSQLPSNSTFLMSRRLQTSQFGLQSTLSFLNNTVQDNVLLGSQLGGLVFANGANQIIQYNNFSYNGATNNGLGMTGIQSGSALLINNIFNNIFCVSGCLSFADSSFVNVTQNQISQLIGQGIVVTNSQVLVMNQVVQGSYASFISQTSQSFTNITNCQFIGCLGQTGAVLYSRNSQYYISNSKFTGIVRVGSISQIITRGYKGIRPLSFFMNQTAVNQLNQLTNVNGQIYINNRILNPTQSTIVNCNFTNLTGGIAAAANLRYANVIIINNGSTQLYNNNANTSSLITAQSSNLVLQGLNFVKNQAANGIISSLTSMVLISNCQFSNNWSFQGGVYVSSQDLLSSITSSSFIQNRGSATSALFGLSTQMVVVNGTFINNQGQSSSVEFINSQVNVSNSYFGGNSANLVTNGFILINTQLIISNSTIENSVNPNVQVGFFSLMVQSQLTLQNNTVVKNLQASIYGVLSAMSQSQLILQNNVTVSNCTGQNSAFYIGNSAQILINQSTFFQSPQSIFNVLNSNLIVQNSNFYNQISGSMIQLQYSNITMTNTQMHDTVDSASLGVGILCSQCGQVTISNSSFTNITSYAGGVNLDASNIQIQNSIFAENIAILTGGGLFINVTTGSSIQVTGNTFAGNIAQNGGAVAFGCVPYQCQSLVANNLFSSNTAYSMGGALQYFNQNFTSVYNNIFAGNYAPYGAILGSWPSNFAMVLNGQQFNSSNETNFNATSIPVQISPGAQIILTGQLFDCEGRYYTPENTAIARVQFVNTSNLQNQVIGNSAIASQGSIFFTALSVLIAPNSTAYATLFFQQFENYDNNITFIDNPMLFLIDATECVVGEYFTESLECILCSQGYYLFETSPEPQPCNPCLLHATCYGGSNISPNAGYWRTGVLSDQIIQCFNQQACLGGNLTEPMTLCATGYNGILCSQCDVGYEKRGHFGCWNCVNVAFSIVYFLVCLTVIIVGFLYFFRSQMLNLAAGSKPVTYVYFKILVSHFQLMGLVANINFQWDSGTDIIMLFFQRIADSPLDIFFPSCLIQSLSPTNDSVFPSATSPRIFYLQVAAAGVFPLLLCAVLALVFYCKEQRNTDRNKSQTAFKDNLLASMIIFMFICYPKIIQILLQSLNCNTLLAASGDPTIRLMRDMNETCYQGNHLILILIVTIPSIIIWMVLCPYYLFKSFKDNANLMMQIEKQNYTNQDAPLIASFMTRHGFLMSGFNSKDHEWELYLLYQKLALVFICVFLQQESCIILGLLVLVFQCGAMFLLYKYDNYYITANKINDDSELKMHPLKQVKLLSLFTQIITVYVGLFFTQAPGDTTAAVITVIVVGLVQIVFFTFFYMKIRIEMVSWIILKEYKGKFVTFFLKVFCCVKDRYKFQLDQEKIQPVHSQAIAVNNQSKLDVGSEVNLSSYLNSLKDSLGNETVYSERTRHSVFGHNSPRTVNPDEIEFNEKPIPRSVKRALRHLPDPNDTEEESKNPRATFNPREWQDQQRQVANAMKDNENEIASKIIKSKMVSRKAKFDSKEPSIDNGNPEFDSKDYIPKITQQSAKKQQEQILETKQSAKTGIMNFFPDESSSENNSEMPSSHRIAQQQNFAYKQELEFEKEENKQKFEPLDSDLEDNQISAIVGRRGRGPVIDRNAQFNQHFGRRNDQSEHMSSEFESIESGRSKVEGKSKYQPGDQLSTPLQMNILQMGGKNMIEMGGGASRRFTSEAMESDGRLNTYGSKLNSDGQNGRASVDPNNMGVRGTYVPRLNIGVRNDVDRISEQSYSQTQEFTDSHSHDQSGLRPSQSGISQSESNFTESRDSGVSPGEMVGKLFKPKQQNAAEIIGKLFQRQSAPATEVVGKLFQRQSKK